MVCFSFFGVILMQYYRIWAKDARALLHPGMLPFCKFHKSLPFWLNFGHILRRFIYISPQFAMEPTPPIYNKANHNL